MIQTGTVLQTREEQLAALYQNMQANNDGENAEKILDLYRKLKTKELVVSFSGHFSAGKSSMINTLLGKDILPKSPIPTSANIVKLASGEGWARVFFTEGNPVEYKEPYDLDMIKAYSQDRSTIKRIEISTKDAIIPEGSAIIDTPGIDAADDADRLMTESALHLVDMLFYVMDYNHVQSEVNLYFLKSIQENGIPFYLIINQIDKHNHAELSFASFKESIRRTFQDWEIAPKQIFYTSLFDFTLPDNQFAEVKETLFSILENEGDRYFNIDASVRQVIENHKTFLEEQYGQLKNEMEIDGDLEGKLQEMENLEKMKEQLAKEPEELERTFEKELTQTLQNAYIMPKELRDKAQTFLEAEQPGFKVGLFGSKKKTAEERMKRMQSFESALNATIQSTIQWKLRDKYVQLLKDFSITEQTMMEEVNQFTIDYRSEDFKKLVKSRAQVNGEYVLNYTNDVANDIKSKFKRKSYELLEKMKQALQTKHESMIQRDGPSEKDIQAIEEIQAKYAKIQQELEDKQQAVENLLQSPVYDAKQWQAAIQKHFENEQLFIEGKTIPLDNHSSTIQDKSEEVKKEKPYRVAFTAEEMVERIEEAIAHVEGLPGFDNLIADLTAKKQRLENRRFTIALFGAFSAGKSSFSNALIGKRILPVSPNPTTATVNRIHPVSDTHPHGTVVVTMKNDEVLYHELLAMTQKFSPRGDNFERLLRWAEKKNITENDGLNNMYRAYIQALIKGYRANEERIGKQVSITFDDFSKYVTDETIACYIEAIDVYYDCTFTQQGITLVDTPGADSVNARHTDVAFNYIKHADAILYVTYYNHALSRADKDFLMQLGRVKEAFQLDKMFFIVNAADLASNDEELQLVTSYVRDELLKLGIRQAKLFPVSSKLSMEEKENNMPLNEKMKEFEEQFYSFIHHDLAALTIDSARWDIMRVAEMIEHYLATMTMNDNEKEAEKAQIKQDVQTASSYVSAYETDVYGQQIAQRIEKQLFYVADRLGIRYHDMFKEMFNPTTITENGRRGQAQVKNAFENLLEYIRFELNQELQAVSIRVERLTSELANDIYQEMQTKSKEINRLFSLPSHVDYELSTPVYEEQLTAFNRKDVQPILATYKGTKAFFVQNDKDTMKEKLYSALLPSIEHFIAVNQEKMTNAYLEQWQRLVGHMKGTVVDRLQQQMDNYFTLLEMTTDMEKMETKVKRLQELTKEKQVESIDE